VTPPVLLGFVVLTSVLPVIVVMVTGPQLDVCPTTVSRHTRGDGARVGSGEMASPSAVIGIVCPTKLNVIESKKAPSLVGVK
jgi:hypothetical protein